MNKQTGVSSLRTHINEAKNAFDAILRFRFMASLLTIAVIGISIAIPGFFYLMVKNVSLLADNLSLEKNITVYLSAQTSNEAVNIFANTLKKDPHISKVRVILNNEGLAQFERAIGMETGEVFAENENPLPHAIIVTPGNDAQTQEELTKLVQYINSNNHVESVRLDKDWFTKINSFINVLSFLCFFVGVILFFSLLLTVINSISNRVILHADEIEVMKLVGATDNYICRTYAYMGACFGGLGGFWGIWLATLALFLTSIFFDELTQAYGFDYSMQGFSFGEFIFLLLFSTLSSLVVAVFSARRAIARIELVE